VETLRVDLQGPETVPYVELLRDLLPKVRNEFAHPHQPWIVMPGDALNMMRLAVEITNQLWP
jgi:hypothetical protein